MFFTSEVTLPLETTTDVLEAYPTWTLKVMNGMQMQFQGSNVPKVSFYTHFNIKNQKINR